jgi:hypothetical protein
MDNKSALQRRIQRQRLNRRYSIIRFVLIFLLLVLPVFLIEKSSIKITSQSSSNVNGLDLNFDHTLFLFKPAYEEVVAMNEKKVVLDEQERLQKIREGKIQRILALLSKNRSPIASRGYAEQILDLTEKNNSDYRVLIALMGVESGFCRAPYLKNGVNTYNCFGYLNGVVYSSFTDAFNNLIPKICRQYINRYGWDFENLARAYGELSWEKNAVYLRGYASVL